MRDHALLNNFCGVRVCCIRQFLLQLLLNFFRKKLLIFLGLVWISLVLFDKEIINWFTSQFHILNFLNCLSSFGKLSRFKNPFETVQLLKDLHCRGPFLPVGIHNEIYHEHDNVVFVPHPEKGGIPIRSISEALKLLDLSDALLRILAIKEVSLCVEEKYAAAEGPHVELGVV